MTATARQLITRALRRARIISEGETPEASMMTDGLEVLNDMMANFNADGILYAHVELTVDQALNVPDEQIRYVRDLLVGELSEEYGQEMGPMAQAAYMNARRTMQALYFIPRVSPVDAGVNRRTVVIGTWGPFDPLLVDQSGDAIEVE